jgi:hypothetical protein
MLLTTGEVIKVGISIQPNGEKVSFVSFPVASLLRVYSFDRTAFDGIFCSRQVSQETISGGRVKIFNSKGTYVGIDDIIKFVSDSSDKWNSRDRLSATRFSSPANH